MEQDELYFEHSDEPSGIGTAVLLVIVLVLMVAAFVWFVVRLDPLTADFIELDSPVATMTPEPEGT